jgi:hypothetical protein
MSSPGPLTLYSVPQRKVCHWFEADQFLTRRTLVLGNGREPLQREKATFRVRLSMISSFLSQSLSITDIDEVTEGICTFDSRSSLLLWRSEDDV